MKKIINRIEKDFAAVAFAEQGEHETALRFLGHKKTTALNSQSISKWFETISKWFEKMTTAITFAEAGCPEMVAEFIDTNNNCQIKKNSLDSFMNSVGLKGVNFNYRVVSV